MAKKVTKRAPAAKATPDKNKKGGRPQRTDRQRAFLRVFAETCSVAEAARAVRIHRSQHYDWMEISPEYAAQFQKIVTRAAGAVEDEIVRRAMKGIFEPNVFQGRFVYPQEEYVIREAVIGPRGAIREPEVRGWRDKPGAKPLGIRRYSDSLLALLARAWMPHKYRSTAQVEVSGPDGGPLEIVRRLNAARDRMAARAKERDE